VKTKKKKAAKAVTLLTKIEALLSDVLDECSAIEKSVERNVKVLIRAAEVSVNAAKKFFVAPPAKPARRPVKVVKKTARKAVKKAVKTVVKTAAKRPTTRARAKARKPVAPAAPVSAAAALPAAAGQ